MPHYILDYNERSNIISLPLQTSYSYTVRVCVCVCVCVCTCCLVKCNLFGGDSRLVDSDAYLDSAGTVITNTHTHTHTHTLSLTHTHAHSLTHSHKQTTQAMGQFHKPNTCKHAIYSYNVHTHACTQNLFCDECYEITMNKLRLLLLQQKKLHFI